MNADVAGYPARKFTKRIMPKSEAGKVVAHFPNEERGLIAQSLSKGFKFKFKFKSQP